MKVGGKVVVNHRHESVTSPLLLAALDSLASKSTATHSASTPIDASMTYAVPFSPREEWALTPSLDVVFGVSDTFLTLGW